ncbi:putative Na+/H+ antiporter [Deltaproteobacteria bacterium TL4]
MTRYYKIGFIFLLTVILATLVYASGGSSVEHMVFPRSLDSYQDAGMTSLSEILSNRIQKEPFNLFASLIFLCAIIHTFLTSKFLHIAHQWNHAHEEKKKAGKVSPDSVHFGAEIFHFFGEVEVVFGLWALVLGIALAFFYNWRTFIYYIGDKVNYTEPMFVVIIMTIASTRPILKLSELIMLKIANIFGGGLSVWWLTILTLGPLLGSFITEPAAMTISALMLGEKFYKLGPSEKFKYATIGLLFVNVSVGGTLSHFAAPPVLMVATPWHWDFGYMLGNFGWKAALGIVIANSIYFLMFKNEMLELGKKYVQIRKVKEFETDYIKEKDLELEFERIEYGKELGFIDAFDQKASLIKTKAKKQLMGLIKNKGVEPSMVEEAFDGKFENVKLKVMQKMLPQLLPEEDRMPYHDPYWDSREEKVPNWIMAVHVLFLAWTVINAHHPALFIAGFLFLLGFAQTTLPFQNRTNLKPALLVGFFLAGLVIHGGMQAWWIAPVLGSLTEVPLMLGATFLTAFNDNAAITFLSTLVPGFTPELKYAVVAGAVTGGGFTVIANAPNPAGQAILSRYFEDGVSPIQLAKYAVIPTIIMGLSFMLLRF